MATVTIYKVDCTKAYQIGETGSNYSLTGWGCNTMEYEGSDDGGEVYRLPDGFRVAMSNGGDAAIYDQHGQHWQLFRGYHGPAIAGLDGIIALEKSDARAETHYEASEIEAAHYAEVE